MVQVEQHEIDLARGDELGSPPPASLRLRSPPQAVLQGELQRIAKQRVIVGRSRCEEVRSRPSRQRSGFQTRLAA